jgi:hypothetical protein
VLLDPHFKRFHQQLGYAVDEVLAAIPHFEQLQTVRDEIHALSDDPSWVRIKDRVLAHWDNTFEEGCSTHGLTKAPHLQDLLRRCSFDRTLQSSPFQHVRQRFHSLGLHPIEASDTWVLISILTRHGQAVLAVPSW